MNQKIYFAQKGFVLGKTKLKMLVIKYSDAKYMENKLKNKLGLPGKKLNLEKPQTNHLSMKSLKKLASPSIHLCLSTLGLGNI